VRVTAIRLIGEITAMTETPEFWTKKQDIVVAVEKVEATDDEDCKLESSQELSGRTINPMKLMVMLRLKFGLGRYEISVRTYPPSDGLQAKYTDFQ
jgi:hypothetical protein